MKKNKKLLSIVFALVLSMIVTVSFVACQPECKHKFGEWVNRNGDETFCENRLYFRTCENCGEEDWKEGAESDHEFEHTVVGPTCTENGYAQKTCVICGKTEIAKDTAIVTHDFGEWQNISGDETPCESRRYYRTCGACGETEWKDGTQDEHDYETQTVEPTCESAGYDQKVCTLCGKTEAVSGTETPLKEHELNNEYIFDSQSHWYDCKNCDYETEHSKHIFNNNDVCTVCNQQISMAGLIFTDKGDYYEVSGYEGTEQNVIIPSIYSGKPVTSIGDKAFYQNFKIESVVIGSNINAIGISAFSNCYELKSVYIPDSVTVIADYAFFSCNSLTSVHIPKSVSAIGSAAFAGSNSLTSITVDEDNNWYKSIDGNLYSKNGKILAQYAVCKTDSVFKVPDGVESIEAYAFTISVNLTSVIMSDGVKSIGAHAFLYCPKLSSVLIPSSVESIGDWAFSFCDNLFSVYCYEQSDIIIGRDNESLTTATTYYYSESEPTEDGNYWHYGESGEIEVWQKNASQGLIFELNDDGVSYSVVGMGDCKDTELVIPNFYSGLPVTTIGRNAFAENDTITHVTIPDSVRSVETTAFASCKMLRSVIIGKGVKSIGLGAFTDCMSLTSITVDEKNSTYMSVDGNVYSKDGRTIYQYAMGNTDNTFVIPSSVEEIYIGAFAHSPYLTEIAIPDSVTSIGVSAFYNCDNLVSVVIGKSVEYINALAFNDCNKLTFVCYYGTESEWAAISIPGDNNYIRFATVYYFSERDPMVSGNYWHYGENGEVEIWEHAAFAGLEYKLNPTGLSYSVIGIGNYEDAELIIPSVYNGLPVTNIGEYAFAENDTITHVTISDSVKSIETTAFASCKMLRSVTIGKGVESIGFGAFTDCPSLISITVDVNNIAYKNMDGNLYTKDGKTLVQYAMGNTDNTFVIPSSVEEIYVGAFAHSPYLTSVVIPDSVKKIGISAFYNCDNLESIVIAQSVEYIGFSAFDDCDKLDVYYLGTESDWASILIGGDDDELLAVDDLYYYSKSEPLIGGNYWHYGESGEIEIW